MRAKGDIQSKATWDHKGLRPAVLAGAIGILIAGTTYFGASGAVLVFLFVLAFPAQLVFGILLSVEEEVVAGGHSSEVVSPLVRFGSEFYSATLFGFRLPLIMILAATICVIIRSRTRLPPAPMFILVALVGWSCLLGLSQGYDLKAAVGASTPWIVILCGFVIGSYIAVNSRIRMQIIWIAATIIFIKAVIGVYVFLSGGAIPDPSGLAAVVYYDSTISYVAMTFLVGWMFSEVRKGPGMILMTSSVVVILVAMRRNVIAAAAWALFGVTLLRGSWKHALRIVAGLALLLAGVWVFLPGPIGNIVSAFDRSFSTLLTGEGDSSTTGHVSDIEVGTAVIMQSPIWGLGVYPEPQAGLVVGKSDNLYIHNELLQTWARFGLVGVLVLVMLLGLAITYAVLLVRKGSSDLLGSASAVYFLACPIPLMFFPHLSTLVRFAFFAGFFLAILSQERHRGSGANGRALQMEKVV